MKFKEIFVSFLILLIFLIFSCAQNPSIETTTISLAQTNQFLQTNYINNTNTIYETNINYTTNTNIYTVLLTNYYTNTYQQTNYVYGLQSNVYFSLVGITESVTIQPYYLVEGILEGGFSYNDVDKFYLIVTNNSFSNNFQFYSLSNFTGVISAPSHNNI
ncbi:MAG: hypothetical protein N2712_04430, partial [Brevinematales bacterium]|nr:hypothetical protein [Brevinematales bacterium]